MPPLSSPPDNDVSFEHPVANVFEADRRLPHFAPEFRGNLVDHLRGRKRLRHVAGQIARSGQMPEQNRKNLVRRDERAVAVDRADAVRVAIEREACVIAAIDHRPTQRLNVRLDRLGIHAAEKRIARAANFGRLDAVTAEKLAQQSAARSVHRIDHVAEFRRLQPVPIDERIERIEIRRANVERMNQLFARGQRRHAVAQLLLRARLPPARRSRARPSCRNSP